MLFRARGQHLVPYRSSRYRKPGGIGKTDAGYFYRHAGRSDGDGCAAAAERLAGEWVIYQPFLSTGQQRRVCCRLLDR